MLLLSRRSDNMVNNDIQKVIETFKLIGMQNVKESKKRFTGTLNRIQIEIPNDLHITTYKTIVEALTTGLPNVDRLSRRCRRTFVR